MIQDFLFGFRLLRRHPVETGLAVVAIALGVGLSTAMFSILWGTVLRGLPFPDADRLAQVEILSQGEKVPPSDADFLAWRRGQRSFEGLAAWLGASFNVSSRGLVTDHCNGAFVTANTFRLIQVHPVLGRDFSDADEAPGAPMVAILSARRWKEQFHQDPEVLGKPIKVNSRAAQVIGVMPEGFGFPLAQELWIPLQFDPTPAPQGQPMRVQVFGKLKRGVSLRQAAADLRVTAPRSAKNPATGIAVTPFVQAYTEDLQPTLYLLFAASLGLLLVVLANVSGLLTAQTVARLPELAVRSSLGATRWRILAQLLAEATVLGAAGTALSIPLALAAIRTYIASQGGELRSFWMDVHLDAPVIAYALSIAALVSFLSALLPSFRATGSRLNEVLKQGAGKNAVHPPGAGSKLRLMVQLALSFALLASTGLVIESLGRLGRLDFGFAPEKVLTAQLYIPYSNYPKPEDKLRFLRTLEERLGETLGPGQVAFASALPGSVADEYPVEIEGQQPLPSGVPAPMVQALTVSGRYFDLLHVPGLQGRLLGPGDRAGGQLAVVINQSFARRFFAQRNPVGARLRLGASSPWRTVVGVVPDLVMGAVPAPHPEGVYLPLEQKPLGWVAVMLRTPGSPARFTGALQRSVAAIDPEVPVFWVETLQERSDDASLPLRTMAQVFTAFGTAALFLSLLGIYGVTSRSVTSRSREMAIRLTLGARKSELLRQVLRTFFFDVAAGIALGMLISLAASRLLTSMLFDVHGRTSASHVIAAFLLAAAGLLACLLPAARVLKVEPAEVLRGE